MSMNVRFAQLISTEDSAGPTACEAKAPVGSATATCRITPLSIFQIIAFGFLAPNGSPPLNTLLARPSQKLRKLYTALITVGALRPVTWRVPTEPEWNTASVV